VAEVYHQLPLSFRRKRETVPPRPCETCGKMFKPENNIMPGRFCSMACRDALHAVPARACEICGKTFKPRDNIKPGRYCSISCYAAWQTQNIGEKSPKWKGGYGTERRRLMERTDYQAWRTAVFARDGYTCQKCGANRCRLNAHHRKPWRAHPDLRYDLGNGVTLCVPCHKAVHRGSASSS
jgi:hypothetical protein